MALPNFGQLKELYGLQKKAKQAQKELKNIEIEASSNDGWVKVIVSGDMKVKEISIKDDVLSKENRSKLERTIVETISQALSRAQTESAARLSPMLKDLKIPGL